MSAAEDPASAFFLKLKQYFGTRVDLVLARVKALEDRPLPDRGEKGDPGERGNDAENGKPGDRGDKGDPGDIGQKGDPGEKGDPGLAGDKGDPGDKGERGDKGDKGEKGDPGDPGLPSDPGKPGDPGRPGDKGLDGAKGDKGDAGEKGDPGLNGKDGSNGLDGNLAALHVLGIVDASKRYDRGTWAAHAGGLIFSTRATDPLEGKTPAESGWLVLLNGISVIDTTSENEGRTITRTIHLTNGDAVEEIEKRDFVIDRGVFRTDQPYEKGDHVSSGGSGWIAQRSENLGRPGQPDSGWRLSTKAGRDGKDGKDGEKGERGRDLTR